MKTRNYNLKRVGQQRMYELYDASDKFTAFITRKGDGWYAVAEDFVSPEPLPRAIDAADQVIGVEDFIRQLED